MADRARKAEKEKKRKDRRKEKRREASAEDASEDKLAVVEVTDFPGDEVIAGVPSKRKTGPGSIQSACDVCKKRKSACPWPGVKKAPKKSKPAAGKKKSAIVSSDSEVEEIVPVVIPCTHINRAAEQLSEAKRRLADVERENRDLRRLVWELQDEVHRSFEGSSQLAQFVAGLIGFQSRKEKEMSWMGDAMAESQQIAEDFRRREGGQGGLGLTAEEKEEAEKKKKHAEVDVLADTDGKSEKSDDAEDSPKVKEEKMDEGEAWGVEFRRACSRTPPPDTERLAKGKGRAKQWVQSDDEEVDSPKNSEDEENTNPDADVEEDVAGKQMSEPLIVTEDVPKSDD
ncbi:hypothetical protein B0H19DRAFT_1064921 [Mycena capillaripes]|nr:hypothetical protein B0H19DRAFT_1064921 [Mycena capillaripes]